MSVNDQAREHGQLIERMRGMANEEIYQGRLFALVNAVEKEELTVDDVLVFTTIPKDEFILMLEERRKQNEH